MRTKFPFMTGQASGIGEEGRPERGFRRAGILVVALVVVWIAIQMLPNPEPLQPDGSETISSATTTRSLIGPGYLIGLALLAGAGVFAVVLKRKAPVSSGGAMLRELGRLKTGPQQNIHLVACGDDVLLIGATPGQVSLLKQYPSEFFEDSPVQNSDSETVEPDAERQDFLHVLGQYSSGVRSYRTNKLYPRRSGASS